MIGCLCLSVGGLEVRDVENALSASRTFFWSLDLGSKLLALAPS